jgi:hypothetical protein
LRQASPRKLIITHILRIFPFISHVAIQDFLFETPTFIPSILRTIEFRTGFSIDHTEIVRAIFSAIFHFDLVDHRKNNGHPVLMDLAKQLIQLNSFSTSENSIEYFLTPIVEIRPELSEITHSVSMRKVLAILFGNSIFDSEYDIFVQNFGIDLKKAMKFHLSQADIHYPEKVKIRRHNGEIVNVVFYHPDHIPTMIIEIARILVFSYYEWIYLETKHYIEYSI